MVPSSSPLFFGRIVAFKIAAISKATSGYQQNNNGIYRLVSQTAKALRERKRSDVWRGTQCLSRCPTTSKTAAPLVPGYSLKEPKELEEEEESLLHWQTAAVTTSLRADEQSTERWECVCVCMSCTVEPLYKNTLYKNIRYIRI